MEILVVTGRMWKYKELLAHTNKNTGICYSITQENKPIPT